MSDTFRIDGAILKSRAILRAMGYADGKPATTKTEAEEVAVILLDEYRRLDLALQEIAHAGTVAWARKRAERALEGK